MLSSPTMSTSPGQAVLAIDIGTSSARALVCDAGGSAIAGTETQIAYSLRTTQDGGAELEAESLLALVIRAIDETLAKHDSDGSPFVAVGVTSFWHSLLGLDASATPVTPVYFWADSRSDDTIAGLAHRVDQEAIRQRTGCRLHSSYWPAKLYWLRTTDPERFGRVDRWLSFTEFLSQRLMSESDAGISVSMASGTGLLDVHTTRWDGELVDLLGLSLDRLPRIVDLGDHTALGADFAARWPALAGVPWVPALGDGACANVGSGAVGPERLALTLGTSGALRIVLPAPAGEEWPVPPGLWAYRLDRDHAVLGGALSNGGNFRRWLVELTGASYEQVTPAAIADTAADSHGLTILPFLAGERSPGWHVDATGVIAGLTLATTPADLLRAGMEAVAFRFAQIYDELRPIAAPTHQIIGNGGAVVSSPEWTQIIASALNHEILALPAGDEATARGAALVALKSVGVLPELDAAPDPALMATPVKPDVADHQQYLDARQRQAALEALLYPSQDHASRESP